MGGVWWETGVELDRVGDRGQGWYRVEHKGESWIEWETGRELG